MRAVIRKSSSSWSIENRVPLQWIKELPKCELSSSLCGSISLEGLDSIIQSYCITITDEERRTLDEDPVGFDEVAQVLRLRERICFTSLETIAAFTSTCILEAAADGVQYIELRTKLLTNKEAGITKQNGLAAILSVLNKIAAEGCWNSTALSTTVKLVLTIDRNDTLDTAFETVDIAIDQRFRDKGHIVGIDLAGYRLNPEGVSSFSDIKLALLKARDYQLKISIHCAQHDKYGSSNEISDILDFESDRLSNCHVVDSEFESRISSLRIPIEVCLTSLVKTRVFKNYQELKPHVTEISDNLVLCTKHAGLFGSTLSMEYAIASRTYDLSKEDLIIFAQASINAAFCTDAEKEALRARLRYVLEKIGYGHLNPESRRSLENESLMDLSPHHSTGNNAMER